MINSEVNFMKTRGRISGVELYRALLMFGICLLHAAQGHGGVGSAVAVSILQACVCGFVFISGWFGIRFRPSKLVRLYGVGVFAALVNAVIFHVYDPLGCGGLIGRCFHTLITYWFLHAYAVLMLMSPLLNLALRDFQRKEGFLAIVFTVICVIGWSFTSQLPLLRSWFPTSAGLQNYSGFMFMGIYLIAGMWRELKFDKNRHIGKMLGGVILLAITALYPLCLGAYSSPFSILIAGMCFCVCKGFVLPVWLDKACLFVAPSLFSIYLIHTNKLGFQVIRILKTSLTNVGCPYSLSCLGIAVVFFTGCLAIDLVRRLMLYPLTKLVNAMMNRLDEVVDEQITKLYEKCT